MERPTVLLRVSLLGRFEVVRDDAPIPAQAWRRRRPADLLKLVALAPNRTIRREAAIDALWSEKDPGSGANNLHRALYDLRQILGGRWVDIDRGALRLRPDVWLDVDAFEHAVTEGTRESLALAVSLYRGDLAPESPDSAWLKARRAALRRRFVGAALPIAEGAAAAGDAAAAIPLLRRTLESDPSCEDAHRLLMRLLAESGRRAESLRGYEACEIALRAAGLGAPSAATRGLRDAIQRGELGPAQGRAALDGARRAARRLLGATDLPPLRGRNPSLLLLESLVESGAGALVLLGERGVGKTRLALEGARIAQARGAKVLSGIAGGTGPAPAPYALFADLFRDEARANPAHADPFAEASAGTTRTPHEQTRRRLFDAVRSALRTTADGAPLFLLLEDLHDADESSLNLVHLLALEARPLGLLVVATCREEAVHAGTPIANLLAHLDCERLARGIRVPRLGLGATREQVQDLLGAPAPEALVTQVYRVTDGSPYYTEEVLLAHRETGAVPSADPAAAIRARATRLGPRAEAVLHAGAIVGDRFGFEAVRPVCGLSAHEALAALDGCVEARLLDEDGVGYRFHNALARDAILEALPAARRAELHGDAADALEAAPAGSEPASEAIAWHRREAGQPERALRHFVAAGHRAAARAGLSEAAGFYGAALAILEASALSAGAQRYELLDALGRAQLGLGELGAAARSFAAAANGDAASGWEPSDEPRARARRLAAVAAAAAGATEAAAAQAARAASEAERSGGVTDELAPLHHLRAQLLWHAGRNAEAQDAARRCIAAAEAAGDGELAARGEDLVLLASAPSAAEDVALATGAAARADQETDPEHLVDLHLVLWDRDLLGDRTVDEVARAAERLGERARARGAAGTIAASRLGIGAAALAAGQHAMAEVFLREALEGFRAEASALGEALALERLATLLALRGRFEAALALLAEGVVVAERAPLRRHALVKLHAGETRLRLASGAVYGAEDALRTASEAAARHGECAVCDAAFRPEAVRVALARGRVEEAEAEAAALESIARARGGRGLFATARLARARVLAARDRPEDAATAFAEARADFSSAGHRTDAARCLRNEVRLRGPALLDDLELRALDALVVVDGDA
jgi:DNA-binding SARP family transcriptional activator